MGKEILVVAAVLAGWLLLQLVILPRMGVST
jgi:hypothetical protein